MANNSVADQQSRCRAVGGVVVQEPHPRASVGVFRIANHHFHRPRALLREGRRYDVLQGDRGQADCNLAQAYLAYLYTDEGQDIIGKHFYRPTSPKAQAQYAKQFPKLNLFPIDQAFGGWTAAAKEHFADGGLFDQIYVRK